MRASALASSGHSGFAALKTEVSADVSSSHDHILLEFASPRFSENDAGGFNRTSILTVIIGFAIMLGVLNYEPIVAKFEALTYRPKRGQPTDWVPLPGTSRRDSGRKARR